MNKLEDYCLVFVTIHSLLSITNATDTIFRISREIWSKAICGILSPVTAYGPGVNNTLTPDTEPGNLMGNGSFPLTSIRKSEADGNGPPTLLTTTFLQSELQFSLAVLSLDPAVPVEQLIPVDHLVPGDQ
jgi:hypothetical protein